MQKKLLAILLSLLMLLSAFPFAIFAEDAIVAEEVVEEIAEPLSVEEEEVFVPLSTVELKTAEDVLNLMNDSSKWASAITLANDIDLSTYEGELTQAPIGNDAKKFTGTFDGQGYEISGINLVGTASSTGFFGWIYDATVRNLTVSGTVTSDYGKTAGLIGYMHFSGDNGRTSLVENCINNCTVTSTGNWTGGLIGTVRNTYTNVAIIRNCENNGAVTGMSGVGGILGWQDAHGTSSATIENCKNTGAITSNLVASDATTDASAGGILGGSQVGANGPLNITKCVNTGNVTGDWKVGGIVGKWVDKEDSTTLNYTISLCWNAGNVSSVGTVNSSRAGGIVGDGQYLGGFMNCLNTGIVSGKKINVGGISGYTQGDPKMGYCLNTTTVVSDAAPHNYVNSVGGFMPVKPTLQNYYMQALQGNAWKGTNGVTIAKYTAADFDTLNTQGAWIDLATPELAVFHTTATCDNTRGYFVALGDGYHAPA